MISTRGRSSLGGASSMSLLLPSNLHFRLFHRWQHCLLIVLPPGPHQAQKHPTQSSRFEKSTRPTSVFWGPNTRIGLGTSTRPLMVLWEPSSMVKRTVTMDCCRSATHGSVPSSPNEHDPASKPYVASRKRETARTMMQNTECNRRS